MQPGLPGNMCGSQDVQSGTSNLQGQRGVCFSHGHPGSQARTPCSPDFLETCAVPKMSSLVPVIPGSAGCLFQSRAPWFTGPHTVQPGLPGNMCGSQDVQSGTSNLQGQQGVCFSHGYTLVRRPAHRAAQTSWKHVRFPDVQSGTSNLQGQRGVCFSHGHPGSQVRTPCSPDFLETCAVPGMSSLVPVISRVSGVSVSVTGTLVRRSAHRAARTSWVSVSVTGCLFHPGSQARTPCSPDFLETCAVPGMSSLVPVISRVSGVSVSVTGTLVRRRFPRCPVWYQ